MVRWNIQIDSQESAASADSRMAMSATEPERSVTKLSEYVLAALQGTRPGATFAIQRDGATVSDDATSIAVDGVSAGVATFTRTGGTSFITKGFRVGQTLVVTAATDVANNGSYPITAVASTVITVTTTAQLTDNATDTTVVLTVPQEVVAEINV